ncbi:hypothetical protein AOLI_G00020930 [Acnodon oligacanthus]
MHVTILRRGQSPVIEKCSKCCSSKYHCPFCKPRVYRPAMELHQVQYHVRNHLSLAVKHEEFYIVKCNLYCRDQAHFHCCYCPTTIIRRVQIVKHLTACRKRCLITKPAIKIEPDAITDPAIKRKTGIFQICPESHFPEPAVKTEPDTIQVHPDSHFPEPAVKTEPDTIQVRPDSHFPEPAVKTEPDTIQICPESHFPEQAVKTEPPTLTKTVKTEHDAATNQPPALLSAHVHSVYYILIYP